ncbi:hypothetical protein Tco_0462196 [Tanacetum coccineum]
MGYLPQLSVIVIGRFYLQIIGGHLEWLLGTDIRCSRIDKGILTIENDKLDGVSRLGKRVMLKGVSQSWESCLKAGTSSGVEQSSPILSLCSNLKKCHYQRRTICHALEGIHVDDKLQFMEEPVVEIMEREINTIVANSSRIPLV